MNRLSSLCALVAVFALGAAAERMATPKTAAAASTNPTAGWNIHVDAKKHFGDAHPDEIAHHWCKPVSGGMIECAIFDSDAADARLVAVEAILPTATYRTLPADERSLWHYHKDEIPKVSATMPDATPDQAKALIAQMTETYGKVYVLWDPQTNRLPIGQPMVSVLK